MDVESDCSAHLRGELRHEVALVSVHGFHGDPRCVLNDFEEKSKRAIRVTGLPRVLPGAAELPWVTDCRRADAILRGTVARAVVGRIEQTRKTSASGTYSSFRHTV